MVFDMNTVLNRNANCLLPVAGQVEQDSYPDPIFCYPVLQEHVSNLSWSETNPPMLLCSDIGSRVALVNPNDPTESYENDVLTSGCTTHAYSKFNASFVASYAGAQTRVLNPRSFTKDSETFVFRNHNGAINSFATGESKCPFIASCSSDGTVCLIDSRQDNVRGSKTSIKPLYEVSWNEGVFSFKQGFKQSGAIRYQGTMKLHDPKVGISRATFCDGRVVASSGHGWLRIDKFDDWNE